MIMQDYKNRGVTEKLSVKQLTCEGFIILIALLSCSLYFWL